VFIICYLLFSLLFVILFISKIRKKSYAKSRVGLTDPNALLTKNYRKMDADYAREDNNLSSCRYNIQFFSIAFLFYYLKHFFKSLLILSPFKISLV
jgi:hypothetical protein